MTMYDFSAGNVTTFLGLLGIISTGIILITAFQRFYKSQIKWEDRYNVWRGLFMHETTMNLNSNEIGILLSALQLVELNEEHRIAKEHGSVPTLYNKLYTELESIKYSDTQKYDHEASYWRDKVDVCIITVG